MGNLVRSFSSKADSTYKKYDGGPNDEPLLSKSKGLNRFVWDMRYSTMPGVPDVYIESSYRGHKASPGKYAVSILINGKKIMADATILSNPLYEIDAPTYKEYHTLMNQMEQEVTKMHQIVNSLNAKRIQLEGILNTLSAEEKYTSLKKEGDVLVKKMKVWDEDMVQRRSKAYDDVENFENKFTANYMFLINQTESDLPRVNQPNVDRLKELNITWATLKAKADEIMNKDIPALNKLLWAAGVGAIWEK